jgi:hypothetical protein
MTTDRALEVGKTKRNLWENYLPMGPNRALPYAAYDDQN